MPIESYNCKIHGKTTAYVYKIKSGPTKGLFRRTCRECRAIEVKKLWHELKCRVIKSYGGKCSCCGENIKEFLTIDHVNGNGKEHRNTIGRGYKLYKWLEKNNYPKDGFRLLCYNCNCARGQFGQCPHERNKK
uniref:HNH endonuclease n=1 Tax=viral metagenome TaxID=1070528 RepID=A0A6M3JU55_9ZZZZ